VANNLHISYDLMYPGQNYDLVIQAIQRLGSWAKIHYSYWYVDSALTAEQAVKVLRGVLDINDSIYIVDATNNQAAWHNINPKAAK
jgi:hypothetical protein